jgi:arylsulfatase
MAAVENFRGRIGVTYKESEPDWPSSHRRRDGKSPNVLIILLDDTGFGNLGCFGSTIETPNIDALASDGLRYSNFHVTPLCSPTRASLLTGLNHHSVGMGNIANYHDIGFPSQRALVSRNAATLAEMLHEEGYSNFALGKWHLNPSEHNSAAGPRDGWPLQRGFDRYYGFLPGSTDQYYPELTYDNHPVYPPKNPEQGYHLTEDLVDHAIEFISDQKSINPDTPFFMYFAPGAMHYPHQAPKEYIDKYRGRFDEGWDVIRERYFQNQLELGIIPSNTTLSPRNPGVKAWDDLGENEKLFMCRLQETWAGFLDHTDAQIGRLIDHLRETDQLDNTVIILTADNGTSQNGGPYGVSTAGPSSTRNATNSGQTLGDVIGRPDPEEHFDDIQSIMDDIGSPNSYADIPWGWSQVGNTPLRWYKQDTHGGGVRVPMIIHYPSGIEDAGGVRNQFHHVSDIAPTILEIVETKKRSSYQGHDQIPISGTSLAYTFAKKDGPTEKPIQYFEMIGNRGLWFDGWKAVTRHELGDDYSTEEWELYNLNQDFSETNNLAEAEPERLRKMIDLWWVEAGRYGVLPLDDRSFEKGGPSRQPGAYHESPDYHFTAPSSHIPAALAPQLRNGNWTLTADIEVSGSETEGVIYSHGSFIDGFSLFVQDNRLSLVHKASGNATVGQSSKTLPPGRITVGLEFEHADDARGTFTFTLNGEEFGATRVPKSMGASRIGGVDIGRDVLAPVTDLYDAPFEFTGVIYSVDIKVKPR